MKKEKIIKDQLLKTKAYLLGEYQKSLAKWNEYVEKYVNAQAAPAQKEDNYYHSDEYTHRQKEAASYWEGVCNSYKWTIDWLDKALEGDKKNGNRY